MKRKNFITRILAALGAVVCLPRSSEGSAPRPSSPPPAPPCPKCGSDDTMWTNRADGSLSDTMIWCPGCYAGPPSLDDIDWRLAAWNAQSPATHYPRKPVRGLLE